MVFDYEPQGILDLVIWERFWRF